MRFGQIRDKECVIMRMKIHTLERLQKLNAVWGATTGGSRLVFHESRSKSWSRRQETWRMRIC
jgi:hypothetical protein